MVFDQNTYMLSVKRYKVFGHSSSERGFITLFYRIQDSEIADSSDKAKSIVDKLNV